MPSRTFDLPSERIAAFCRQNRIRRLSLSGSALHGELAPDSDVDLLAEFEPDARVGLLRMARLERELGAIIGRKVDLRTAGDLSRYFRDEVVRTAEVQFGDPE